MKATIAIIFDFDDTLAPDSTTGLLNNLGVDVDAFWKKVQSMVDGDWDPVPAYLQAIMEESGKGDIPKITQKVLSDWGREVPVFKGTSSVFNRLKKHVREIDSEIKLEFYLISSGIGDVIRNTGIAKNFTDIWCCEFDYDEMGEVHALKKVISFTDKTRYIFQISKGFVGESFRGQPFMVNKKIVDGEIRIPFDQMIVIGDGYTDVPCFSLVRKNGGFTIGVYDRHRPSRWGRAWEFIEDGRVSNLVSADYSSKSDLSNVLVMALESIVKRITAGK